MPKRRLVSLWRWLNLSCREFSRLTTASLDRRLSRTEKCALQVHLLSCVACRRYARQMGFVRKALLSLSSRMNDADSPLPGPGLPPETAQRIKRLIDQR